MKTRLQLLVLSTSTVSFFLTRIKTVQYCHAPFPQPNNSISAQKDLRTWLGGGGGRKGKMFGESNRET